MSLTLRAFALRICYFVGYYKEKVDELEAKIKILEKQNEALSSTSSLYIEYCSYECGNWFVDGDLVSSRYQTHMYYCEGCGAHACKSCADNDDDGWVRIDNALYNSLCNKCKHIDVK